MSKKNYNDFESNLGSTEEITNINEFLKSEVEEIKVKEVKTKSSPFHRNKETIVSNVSFMSFRRVETINTINTI